MQDAPSPSPSAADDPSSKSPRGGVGPDALPPVQPPTAGFILQLFVIPAIIVGVIAAVWLLFSWLAHPGGSPDYLISDLAANVEKDSKHSWQIACTLAHELASRRNHELKRDAASASRLAEMLEKHLNAGYPTGSTRSDINHRHRAIQLRNFLCRAIGEFHVLDGLPVLIRAADWETYVPADEKDLGDPHVRQSALEAIALLAYQAKNDERLDERELLENDALINVLNRAANERSDEPHVRVLRYRLRATSAYAMGVLGGGRLLDRLAIMLDDSVANVRFNAATGLARHGDTRCVEVLVEMLDPEQSQGIAEEEQQAGREFKRVLVIVNSLQATRQLSRANPAADLSRIERAVENLTKADVKGRIQVEATKLLKELRQRRMAELSAVTLTPF